MHLAEFPCPANSLPEPPANGSVRQTQPGMMFAPCAGIYSHQAEPLPSPCQDLKVLITDDHTYQGFDTVYTVTRVDMELDAAGVYNFAYLRFSKEVFAEDVTVISENKLAGDRVCLRRA